MDHNNDCMQVTYRLLTRGDFGLLRRWLSAPHVTKWWRDSPLDAEGIEAKYGPRVDGTEHVEVFIFEVESRPVGIIQRCPGRDYAPWIAERGLLDAIVIDYLIGEEDAVGVGIGSAAIAGFVPLSFERYPEVGAIVASPESTNTASCRALEKVGFECVFEGQVEARIPRSRVYLLLRKHGDR